MKKYTFRPLQNINTTPKNRLFFTLETTIDENETHIVMNMLTPIVNTRDLPNTVHVLKSCCPGVLKTQCFNDEHLPFDKEVNATEIGHLFEHILLECLCAKQIAHGAVSATYNGHTDWNWKRDKWGTFHIFIDAGKEAKQMVQDSIVQASQYTQLILQTGSYLHRSRNRFFVHKQVASLLEPPVVHPSINIV